MPITKGGDLAVMSPSTAAQWMKERRTSIESLLPESMDFRRLARLAVQCLQELPALQNCSGASVMGGILASAQLGLPLGRVQGKAYLIPFKGEAQFIIGVPGYVELAARAGISARCGHVVDGQSIEVDEASGLLRVGLPPDDVDIFEAPMRYVWATWAPVGYPESRFVKVWNRRTVEGRRQRGKNPNGPAWRDNYTSMAVTRVLGAALKNAPLDATGSGFHRIDQSVVRVDDGVLTADSEIGIIDLTLELKPNGGEQNAEKEK